MWPLRIRKRSRLLAGLLLLLALAAGELLLRHLTPLPTAAPRDRRAHHDASAAEAATSALPRVPWPIPQIESTRKLLFPTTYCTVWSLLPYSDGRASLPSDFPLCVGGERPAAGFVELACVGERVSVLSRLYRIVEDTDEGWRRRFDRMKQQLPKQDTASSKNGRFYFQKNWEPVVSCAYEVGHLRCARLCSRSYLTGAPSSVCSLPASDSRGATRSVGRGT